MLLIDPLAQLAHATYRRSAAVASGNRRQQVAASEPVGPSRSARRRAVHVAPRRGRLLQRLAGQPSSLFLRRQNWAISSGRISKPKRRCLASSREGEDPNGSALLSADAFPERPTRDVLMKNEQM